MTTPVRRVLLLLSCVAACSKEAATEPAAPTDPIDASSSEPNTSQGDAATSTSSDAAEVDAEADADADADAACGPVRRFSYTSTAVTSLGCDANAAATIIDAPVPARGRALGRATFDVRLANGSVIHFWNVRVAMGEPLFSYGLGDDLCPGPTHHRSNVGFGKLTDVDNHARLLGYAGAAPCTAGAVEVLAGATLELWVEDEREACAGKDIAFASWYGSKGVADYHEWTTSMAPMPGVVASLTTDAPSEKLRVIGVVEGSPAMNPNKTCGAESSTLVMQTTLDKAVMATSTDAVPASQGMGHLVLFTSGDAQETRSVTPGAHEASLLVGSNFTGTVRTGGCCGDGSVALVRER
ncbi:hypothetical protein [Labilithrix luteola]|nr:hypothetical protein [Labilithrix luteola]